MAKILKVLTYPNPILCLKAQPVLKVDNKIQQLAEDMILTMKEYNGIGLAANQVGVLLQLLVINIDNIEEENIKNKMPLVIINPKIISASKDTVEYEEGCLSFPDLRVSTNRSKKITVQYTNLNNEEKTIDAEDLFAICLQHEIDHLNGYLFINKVSSLKKDILLRKYNKLKILKNS